MIFILDLFVSYVLITTHYNRRLTMQGIWCTLIFLPILEKFKYIKIYLVH